MSGEPKRQFGAPLQRTYYSDSSGPALATHRRKRRFRSGRAWADGPGFYVVRSFLLPGIAFCLNFFFDLCQLFGETLVNLSCLGAAP